MLSLWRAEMCPAGHKSQYREVMKMDKHIMILGAKKRITELLLSESGAADIKKTIGLGTVMTGSMLAAMLLAPTNANADCAWCPGGETCCVGGDPVQYWCCSSPTPTCGANPNTCAP